MIKKAIFISGIVTGAEGRLLSNTNLQILSLLEKKMENYIIPKRLSKNKIADPIKTKSKIIIISLTRV